MDFFQRLYHRQVKWQGHYYKTKGRTPKTLQESDAIVLENLDNAVEEIVEARRCIHVRKGWNPNKCDRAMTREERLHCAEEIIDVIFFLMTSLIYLGLTYFEVQDVLRDKLNFNETREDHIHE